VTTATADGVATPEMSDGFDGIDGVEGVFDTGGVELFDPLPPLHAATNAVNRRKGRARASLRSVTIAEPPRNERRAQQHDVLIVVEQRDQRPGVAGLEGDLCVLGRFSCESESSPQIALLATEKSLRGTCVSGCSNRAQGSVVKPRISAASAEEKPERRVMCVADFCVPRLARAEYLHVGFAEL
jgi:hypothetical protein